MSYNQLNQSNCKILIQSPKNYSFHYEKNLGAERMETFLYKFKLPFILFLYATSFDKQEILQNLEQVYPHKSTFFAEYSDWIFTLTPTDLSKFKTVLLESLHKFKYGNFDNYEDEELLPTLKVLIKDKIYTNVNFTDFYGNTALMWAYFMSVVLFLNF
eukprot:gene11036-3742_t